MKIGTLIGHQADIRTFEKSEYLPSNDFVGLEIELEGFKYYNSYKLESELWSVKEDGSLRDNGKEFIFSLPLNGKDIETALEIFDIWVKKYTENFSAPIVSERCSIHVHVDVRDLERKELYMFMMYYLSLERLLFVYSGKGRYENNYCTPIHLSSDFESRLSRLNSGSSDNFVMALDSSKYAAANTTSVRERGSVEIRTHEGTYDIDRILEWIYILLSIKKASRNNNIPFQDFPVLVSDTGPIEFIRQIFGDEITDKLTYQGFQFDLWKGIRDAQDVIYYNMLYDVNSYYLSTRKKFIKGRSLIEDFAKKHNIKIESENAEEKKSSIRTVKNTIGVEEFIQQPMFNLNVENEEEIDEPEDEF